MIWIDHSYYTVDFLRKTRLLISHNSTHHPRCVASRRSLEVNSAICRKRPPDLSTTKIAFLERKTAVAAGPVLALKKKYVEINCRVKCGETDGRNVVAVKTTHWSSFSDELSRARWASIFWVSIQGMNKLLQLNFYLRRQVLENLVKG